MKTPFITTIKPGSSWQFFNLRELWQYRELLGTFVRRDIALKYKQTIIGASWAVVQPLLTMIIFSFFFGKLAKIPSEGVPYPIFSYSGLLIWTYFSNSLSASASSLVGSSNLITKVYFPRIIIPLSATLNGIVDYAISFIILIGLMLYYQISISSHLLALPLILIVCWLLASGMGFFLSSLNVKYRDIRYVIPFFLQLLIYVTPVIYPSSVAERFKFVLLLNPMTGIVETHRALILSQSIPWETLLFSITLSVLILLAGGFYFKKVERSFADVI